MQRYLNNCADKPRKNVNRPGLPEISIPNKSCRTPLVAYMLYPSTLGRHSVPQLPKSDQNIGPNVSFLMI